MDLADSSSKRKPFTSINQLIWNALDWLYPPSCCSCDQPGAVFCLACQSTITLLNGNLCLKCGIPVSINCSICSDCSVKPPSYSQMRSWAVYDGAIREAIHALKYKQNIALGQILSQPLIPLIDRSNWQFDLIIPIPLSKSHQKQRGYNQTALISRVISKSLGIQHSTSYVSRIRETKAQILLDSKERLTNLDGAFWGNPAKLNKRRVLIIDDVITTGATMKSCSDAIMKAGADQVNCLSVARAILRNPKQK